MAWGSAKGPYQLTLGEGRGSTGLDAVHTHSLMHEWLGMALTRPSVRRVLGFSTESRSTVVHPNKEGL